MDLIQEMEKRVMRDMRNADRTSGYKQSAYSGTRQRTEKKREEKNYHTAERRM